MNKNKLNTTHIAWIDSYLAGYYSESEMPCLRAQRELWQDSQPLSGVRVLDATPVYRNTTAKYQALLAAGAELVIGVSHDCMVDATVMNDLRQAGFSFYSPEVERHSSFDVILDCAGMFAHLTPRIGVVELTRSGVYKYAEKSYPVFLADSGRIKEIETCLGTGESLWRSLSFLGYENFKGKSVVVFGYGKVGRGVVYYALKQGAKVTVVDVHPIVPLPDNVEFCLLSERDKVVYALSKAHLMVTVTGHKGALQGKLPASFLCQGDILMANLGVEDEYGTEFPDSRVLNGKAPLNFILSEPTRMPYIETTMALDNAGALELVQGRCSKTGVTLPDVSLEAFYLQLAAQKGLIGEEMAAVGLWPLNGTEKAQSEE